MTTRWNWENVAPAVSPAYGAAWFSTATAVRMAVGGGSGAGVSVSETSATPVNLLAVQVVSAPLAAGEIAGTFRLAVMTSNTQSSSAFLRVRVRLRADDGTERGTLLDTTDGTALPLGSTQTVTAFSAALTPVTAVAGDRLVVEYGAFMNNTGTTSRSINFGTWASGSSDHAFTDGATATGKPWFEIEPPPDVPTALTQAGATTTTVDVGWTAPAGGSAPTGYDVRVNGGAPTALGLVTSTTLTGLAASTAYTVEVRSSNANGTSAWVSVVATTSTPPPNVPTALTQTGATTTTVDVGWTAPAGGSAPTGYDVRVNGGAPTALGLVTSTTLTGLAASTAYTVEVRSTNAGGTSAWVSVVATTASLPDPPTGLAQTGAASMTVDVGWTAPAGGSAPTGYDLRVDGGAPTALGLVTSTTLTGLVSGTAYTVEVRSTNVYGTSAWVSVVATTASGVPGAYFAHLRVGSHSWDVDSTSPADYGPTSDLRFSWFARQDDGWPTQHDPTILTFGVVVEAGTDFDDVDQGTTVHFTFTPDGYADPLLEFGGTVRDLVGRPHGLGMIYEITAVDHLKQLAEDYTTSVSLDDGDPVADVWTLAMQDADGAGMGIGTRPALPDPFAGDVLPLAGPGWIGPGGLLLTDVNTWGLLTGISRSSPRKNGAIPLVQRAVFTYQLDVDGELDAAHPFEGTWLMQGYDAPVEVDGCLVPTGSTQWSRPRIEPNRLVLVDGVAAGTWWERPHDGVDITREMTTEQGYFSSYSDPVWVLSGLEADDQWSSELEFLASRSPDVVDGWLDPLTGMRTYVEVVDIDPRHTPTGSGTLIGMLAGASLVIPAGGDWFVSFALRRTLPDPDDVNTGGW